MWIRNCLIATACVVVLVAPAALSRVDLVFAQEVVTLGSPITVSQTGWDLSSMLLDVERMRIVIRLKATGSAATTLEKTYDGTVGENLLRGLNKANLTTRSLIERTYDRLITDNVISGTVTGTPR